LLQLIVASTRPGRAGEPVARWFENLARDHGHFEIDYTDLAEVALPLMDEPHHPRLRRYTKEHTRAWSERVERADCFVFVHPEYNHSFTAPLKNAIDYLVHEWAYKPAGLVGYGGVAGGTRAMQALKPVLAGLRMVVPTESVIIPFIGQLVADGRFASSEEIDQGARAMLDELVRLEDALRPLRRAGG
jgi:NAD(P)H-dependent FMN reductase